MVKYSMNDAVRILMERDGNTLAEARARYLAVADKMNYGDTSLEEATKIMRDELDLEVDYILEYFG